ncbi:radial spoke protein 14 [Haematococcus lacustris]
MTAQPQNDAIRLNQRQIYMHEAKQYPAPMASTSVTRGFEAAAIPKIVRELQDSSLIVRQKALLASRELLGSPMAAVQCIAAGITPAILALLQDRDPTVRVRAAGTAEYIVTKELGARDLCQHGGVQQLVACLQDSHTPVRDAAYRALIEAARFDIVRRTMAEQAALVQLMELVQQETPSRALLGLNLLNACVQVRDNTAALEQLVDAAKAIPALVSLLRPETTELAEQAAQLLGLLTSRFEDAKCKAVESGAVPRLLQLLDSPILQLASAAATALMTITVARDGKYAVINTEGGLAKLVTQLNPLKQQLCVNVMIIITNLAEAPEARAVLAREGAAARLSEIFGMAAETGLLRSTAAQAIRQCGFTHLPYELLQGEELPEYLRFPAE